MKKDGFTLVELLAVIVVLGVLSIIVTISVGTTIDTSKIKLSQIQIQKVENAAKLYYLNEGVNESFYDVDENKTCVNVSYLTENDYLEESEVKDPKDNSDILGSVKIIYKNKKYKYEYQDTKCIHSDYFVSIDTVCALISDADNSDSITPGDKYQCKVKEKMETNFEDGYYFYVLSYNDKEGNITEDIEEAATINLIMERNIYYDEADNTGKVATETNKGLVSWASKEDYNDNTNYGTDGKNNKGPITAMNYLYKATVDWKNIPNLIINYSDYENEVNSYGYGSIKTTNGLIQITEKNGTIVTVLTNKDGYVNLKARMPYLNEVKDNGNCLYNQLDRVGSCPSWLSDYLAPSNYGVRDGLTDINGINGYWTLSSKNYEYAWRVHFERYVDHNLVSDLRYGVRPVITLGL